MQHLFSETPGHDSYPIESIIGTLGRFTDDRMFDYLEWQLKNLSDLQHPKTVEIQQILEENGYYLSDRNIFLRNIPIVRRELTLMSHTIKTQIQDTVREKVTGFLAPESVAKKIEAA